MTDIVSQAQQKLQKLDAKDKLGLLFPKGSFLSRKLIVLVAVCGALLYLFFGDKAAVIPGIVQLVSIYLIVQGCVDINQAWTDIFKAKHLSGPDDTIKTLPPT